MREEGEEKIMTESLEYHKVVSKSEWVEARKRLLDKEKELQFCATNSARSDAICLG